MATPGSYLIQVRAANLSLLGEIDQWENLVLHLRRNKTGAFAFAVPASAPLVPYLAAGNGVVISRNGTVLLSGPFRVLERQWTAAGDQVEPGESLHVGEVFGVARVVQRRRLRDAECPVKPRPRLAFGTAGHGAPLAPLSTRWYALTVFAVSFAPSRLCSCWSRDTAILVCRNPPPRWT
jgi:hypothetical protein